MDKTQSQIIKQELALFVLIKLSSPKIEKGQKRHTVNNTTVNYYYRRHCDQFLFI